MEEKKTKQRKKAEELYTVKFGDSMEQIAKDNGMTVLELLRLNELGSTYMKVGQQIKLK